MIRVAVLGVFLSFFTLGAVTYSYADEIEVPLAIHVKPFIEDCKSRGLDLNDVDGFVENKGSRVVVYTYGSIGINTLDLIKDMAFKHRRT